ncbi:DUF4105 domain-containing protein [Agitococcus lubricus]|uniref:Uncharacterized protein DUF4105 n=1 Tax=Agitococcus lubricus TaxID=1077255 RepID=A0A2T5IZJ2_9GAMM|nr:DUF4105 domain-containing protein [Agitococcus lubricus]PTQ89501.1 uncharacterized protein DUF4105 [Agitococcus lubricus]
MKLYSLLTALCCASPLYADALHTWQQPANTQQLSEHGYWRILLRYEQRADQQWQSMVSDTKFFVSPDGQLNPKAELEATLNALSQPAAPDQGVRCLFPARVAWLTQQLAIPAAEIATQACPALDNWVSGINAHQATLVFAADFTNNPSSMFGHTLLRMDTAEQTEETRLLAYAINYAAQTNTSNGLEFAYKGLTGGYGGAFSILPYYEKVKEYNDFENRDLWEYQLNLSPSEVKQALYHLWEIKQINFPYYFLSSNCSYQLLALIEAARPNTYLRKDFPVYAIPTDTLRRVLLEKNILRKLVYRPASGTSLAFHAQKNSHAVNQKAKLLVTQVDTSLDGLTLSEQAQAYEMAYDYLYYQYLAHETEQHTAPSKLRQLLVKRSQLTIPDQRHTPPQPAVDPAQGHATARVSVGWQAHQQQNLSVLEWRPAYQDLLDNDEGYRRGAAIDFLRIRLGYNHQQQEAKLLNATLLNIDSLASRNPFIRPISWNVALGLEQAALDAGVFSEQEQHSVGFVRGGAGISQHYGEQTLCFSLTQAQLQIGNALDIGWRVGAGVKLGCRWQSQTLGQWLLSHQTLFISHEDAWQHSELFGYQWQFTRDSALRLQAEYQQQDTQSWHSIGASWLYYY